MPLLKIVDKGARSTLPFSPAIVAGEFVYVSGQASVDRQDGHIIEGSFEEEMRRSIENLAVILEAEGLTLDHVINVKCYLGSQEYRDEHNRIYPEYFTDPLPTRSTISGVLGTSLKYELDAVAYAPLRRQEAQRA
jgi:2-iminobutanoate/2-iminopropanoate deaminase